MSEENRLARLGLLEHADRPELLLQKLKERTEKSCAETEKARAEILARLHGNVQEEK